MSQPSLGLQIERSDHRPYETVRADDLNSHELTQDALRSWHNRALHSTYGVSFGLDVSPEPVGVVQPDADVPPRRAEVRPGLAYDASGRDLLLGVGVSIPLPPDPRGMTLVLSAVGQSPPELSWTPTDGFRIASGVPLARTLARGAMLSKITLTGPLPSQLAKKYLYDATQNTLTVLGVMTPEDYKALCALATGGDQNTVTSLGTAFSAWPFDAPVPSRARGLNVQIEPFDRTSFDPAKAPVEDTLWQAVVAPGSASTLRGNLLTLSKTTPIALDNLNNLSTQILVLQADEQVALVSAPSPNGDDFTLATIGPPVNSVIDLDAADPIAEDDLVRPDAPQKIKEAIEDLKTRKKITYTASTSATAGNISIVGFLTLNEADTIMQIVRNSPVAVANAFERLTNEDNDNKPVVPASRDAEAQRVPLFPPRSRALAGPRIATGSSLPGRTEWKPGILADIGLKPGATALASSNAAATSHADFVFYEATVLIESAGFTEPPQVIAWVELTSNDGGAANFPTMFQGGIVGPASRPKVQPADYVPIDTRAFVYRLWTIRRWETIQDPEIKDEDKVTSDSPLDDLNLGAQDQQAATLQDWLRTNAYVRWLGVQSDPEPDWDEWPDSGSTSEGEWP